MEMDSTACKITEVVIIIHGRDEQVYVIICCGNTGWWQMKPYLVCSMTFDSLVMSNPLIPRKQYYF